MAAASEVVIGFSVTGAVIVVFLLWFVYVAYYRREARVALEDMDPLLGASEA